MKCPVCETGHLLARSEYAEEDDRGNERYIYALMCNSCNVYITTSLSSHFKANGAFVYAETTKVIEDQRRYRAEEAEEARKLIEAAESVI